MDLHHFDWLEYAEIDVTANGQVVLWTTPVDRYIRPLIMATLHTGTYNHDAWAFVKPGGVTAYITIDATLNRASPSTLHLPHQDLWLPPLTNWQAFISNLTVAGIITPQMYFEWKDAKDIEPHKETKNVRIIEQPVKTNPWVWPF